jgi:hypothetical protein
MFYYSIFNFSTTLAHYPLANSAPQQGSEGTLIIYQTDRLRTTAFGFIFSFSQKIDFWVKKWLLSVALMLNYCQGFR